MFNKIALVAAVLSPLVHALTLNTPASAVATEPLLVTWSTTPGDQTFSLELANSGSGEQIALANNVNPADESITVTLPNVSGGGFTLEAVNFGDNADVFATSAPFSIFAPPS
ncbi:hypothetical protein K435DRAFT_801307 [Dendrothele bispora CBS 962.96]|uniref:Yeast cell wall synthesis Kre9/Knh1-like N-terminal domain-containing protein n=1 Tax=Dendrothele bispora (strain CBS 962.96) TaxID=1314807 RepID=A0A4S8LQQ9_DENBC|nr:hypothetical protein K435DRAFT_801307 [Dendrothele bispora CBS 962.96]